MRCGPALGAICLALAAGTAMARTAPLRGVVEGYYGRPWSGEARRDVIRFLGRHGMNAFVYGPKNDPYHRDRWRDPYPDDVLADLRATAVVARRSRVRFIYALSPALDVCYACDDDFAALTAKLVQLARARIRRFALFFDDAPETLNRPEDIARYGGSDPAALARAHADLLNRLERWLRRRGLPHLALMIPTAYSGTTCRPYHGALAAGLRRRRLPVGWTGPGVFATRITAADARARRACLDGHPVVLWDNFPVNDGVLSNTLHLGPLAGRDPDLPGVLAGYLLNPMTQPHATLVGLGTAAAYLRRPRRYDPDAAWRAALAELDPSGGLAVLAEQTRGSPLDDPDYGDAAALAAALARLEAEWASPGWTAAVTELEAEERRQSAAPDTITASLGGTPLAAEIAPWVAELAAHSREGLAAVELLRAMKPTFTRLDVEPGTITGRVAPPDPALAATLAPTVTGPRPAPDLATYLGCLGNVLGPDIRLCPELGLNVHGKGLYFVPFDFGDVRLITGRNVHEHLIAFVAARYREWTSRQSGVPQLTLHANGSPVPLSADGSFTLPRQAGLAVDLVVATSGGDATSARVE
jgi:hyaluronoglucosaminidase